MGHGTGTDEGVKQDTLDRPHVWLTWIDAKDLRDIVDETLVVRTFACRCNRCHKIRGATQSCVSVTWVVSGRLGCRARIGGVHDGGRRSSAVFPFLFAILPTRLRPAFRGAFRWDRVEGHLSQGRLQGSV